MFYISFRVLLALMNKVERDGRSNEIHKGKNISIQYVLEVLSVSETKKVLHVITKA